jgi:hypothetical protein
VVAWRPPARDAISSPLTMNQRRRTFLTSTLAASAAAVGSSAGLRAAAAPAGREYYDLRAYRLKPGAASAVLERYLEKALLPALDRRGIKSVGVFTELDVNKADQTSAAKPDTPIWVLIPHATLDSFVAVSADLNADPAVEKAGAEYLHAPKDAPAYDRIDSWLLRAFQGHPTITLPEFSKKRVATRVFELRDYESHSELKALAKIAMFNEGEIEVMRDLGMSPVFFGQAVAGPNLPHLRYMTGGPDLAAHLNAWKKFGADPRWTKMKALPRFADATSKNTSRFLAPRPYSSI